MLDISVIIPVYRASPTLPELVERIDAALRGRGTFEIVLVDDGSPDDSFHVAASLAAKYPWVTAIGLARNFGQINALMAGLRQSRGHVCVLMDDDLQNDPADIPRLLDAISAGNDYVFAVPRVAKHPLGRRIASRLTAEIGRVAFARPAHIETSSFLAMTRMLVDEITRYTGPYPYIAGLIFRTTSRGTNVVVDHHPRRHGASNYNMGKLLALWLSGFTNFSVLPLRLASVLGILSAAIGFTSLSVIVVLRLFFIKFQTGWPSAIGALLLFSGVQLLALGLIGEYLGRAFMLLNGTPQYVVREISRPTVAAVRDVNEASGT